MKNQEYLLKKFVKARSAAEALAMDKDTAVDEVFLVKDKPQEPTDAMGFKFDPGDGRVPYEGQLPHDE